MNTSKYFKDRHYTQEFILMCVRWYCTYPISYRNLEKIVQELGIDVDHTTIYRWVVRYGEMLSDKIKPFLSQFNDS